MITTRFLLRSALALSSLAALSCSDPPADTPAPPSTDPVSSDLATVALGGGCYPQGVPKDNLAAQFGQIALINPHWAPVVNGQQVMSDPVLVHGIAHDPHGNTGGDFPSDHIASDSTVSLELDPADRGRLATGNGTGASARLELEWESDKWPDWAWPGEGDRMIALGRWIFDCGHPGEEPGKCAAATTRSCIVDDDCRPPTCADCAAADTCKGAHFAYSSELHPPYATAVIRERRGGVVESGAGVKPAMATRADLFISPDGGAAGDACIVTHQDPLTDLLFSVDCYPLSHPIAPINSRDFSFDVPLPARPAGAGAASWRLDARDAPGGVAAALDVVSHEGDTAPHLTVTARLTQPVAGKLPTGFAGTLWAGWASAPATLTHVRLTVDALVIHNPVKPATPIGRPAPAWFLQAAINGEWQKFAGIDTVAAGQTIAQKMVFDQYLPADAKLRLYSNGASQRCLETTAGKAIRTSVKELGQLSSYINCLMTFTAPQGTGVVDVSYPGPDFGSGGASKSYTTDAMGGDGGNCSVAKSVCVTDDDCPMGEKCKPDGANYTINYHIERIAD